MRLLTLSHKNKPFITSLATFLFGALLVFGIQKVLADNTIYSACVKTSNGNIRMVSANTTCNTGETLISWNQTGPQGIQGPPGPTGTPGSGGGNGLICLGPCSFRDVQRLTGQTSFVGYNFDNAQIYIDLTNRDFSGASFKGAIIGNIADGANFSNADFTNGHFVSGEIDRANFSNTNFTNAEITFFVDDSENPAINFTNTNFTNAIIESSNLRGADMSGAIFNGTIWSSDTICPNGTNAGDHLDNSNNPTCVNNLTP